MAWFHGNFKVVFNRLSVVLKGGKEVVGKCSARARDLGSRGKERENGKRDAKKSDGKCRFSPSAKT